MDFYQAKKRQNFKVIVSEILMFLIVVVTVIILAFVVSGYWINEKFEVERQGMLQIASQPTGADVLIDDKSSWLQKTNTSKVLSVGEHTVVLSKEGYDSWTKTVNINEGLLYKLSYPRLFPLEREKTTIYDTIGVSKAFLSENNEKLLLFSGSQDTVNTDIYSSGNPPASADTPAELPNWKILNLKDRNPEPKSVTLSTLYDFFKSPEPNFRNSIDDYELPSPLTGTEELIFTQFYDDKYLTIVSDSSVTMYKKGDKEPTLQQNLSFVPSDNYSSKDNGFIVFSAGPQIATLDMELMTINEWSVEGESYGWLDESMIYTVMDGKLIVYDYDGLNRRELANNVSNRFPVVIIGDEWLYYFSNDNLVRENLKI